MSIDLQGWYISKRVLSRPNLLLEPPAVNLSRFKDFEWHNADETATFAQQIHGCLEAMSPAHHRIPDAVIRAFVENAYLLEHEAERRHAPIRSFWL